ncbi:MAG: hypothetical protein Solumvirus1_61 [Solumvirus sp.]|uniref:Uncharacterized protein n=1 Tax=Solumvirus sp. TaxID=2487773 RepID=A0A3G5AG43_9VIRU|nr:MAG: hypothetical protein Solumvirus1_61 [Solumvirus sp.]
MSARGTSTIRYDGSYPSLESVTITAITKLSEENEIFLGYSYSNGKYMYLNKPIPVLNQSLTSLALETIGIKDYDIFATEVVTPVDGGKYEPLPLLVRDDLPRDGIYRIGNKVMNFIRVDSGVYAAHGDAIQEKDIYDGEFKRVQKMKHNYGLLQELTVYLEDTAFSSASPLKVMEVKYNNGKISELSIFYSPRFFDEDSDERDSQCTIIISDDVLLLLHYIGDMLIKYARYGIKDILIRNQLISQGKDINDLRNGFEIFKSKRAYYHEYGLSQIGISVTERYTPTVIEHYLPNHKIDNIIEPIPRDLYYYQYSYVKHIGELFPKVLTRIILSYFDSTDLSLMKTDKSILSSIPRDQNIEEELEYINSILKYVIDT